MNELLESLYNVNVDYGIRIKPYIRLVIRKIQETYDTGNEAFMDIDFFLEHFDPTRADNTTCISMIRTPFASRKLLPHWIECRDRIAAHFDSQGLKTHFLLRGLYD